MPSVPLPAIPWLAGLFGAFVGSFLNVCIARMPAHRSIIRPGSACPACGAAIAPWNNVPVLSWFLLRGRCASCRERISARYPFVEALTAGLWVAAWFRFGSGIPFAEALVFLSALAVLFFTDLDERVLPDLVTLPVAGAGLAFSFFRGAQSPFASHEAAVGALTSFAHALAAAVCGAAAFWLLGRLWRFVRPGIETAIGFGDVKLMAMIGAFLGPRLTLLTVFLCSLAGTALYLLVRILFATLPARAASAPPWLRPIVRGLESAGFLVEGRSARLLDEIPFGSILAMGAAVSLFFGSRIIGIYLDLSGLSRF